MGDQARTRRLRIVLIAGFIVGLYAVMAALKYALGDPEPVTSGFF